MTAIKPLSRCGLTLLLRLLNSPRPSISGSVLFEDFPLIADELVDGSWLKPDGALSYLNMGDARLAELTWCSKTGGYRYFSIESGWVTVSPSQVKRFSIDMDILLSWIRGLLDIGAAHRLTTLVDGVFWHLGVIWAGKYRINVYFVRRLLEPDNQRSFLRSLKQESSRTPAIILNASPRIPPLMELPLDVALVPLENVLSRTGNQCTLDIGAVISILRGCSVSESRDGGIGLRFSTDYRQVYWNGNTYKLTKKQAAVMECLHREGGRAHKDLLRAEANTNEELHRIMRNKVDGKWVQHPIWNTLLKGEGNGYYYLDDE